MATPRRGIRGRQAARHRRIELRARGHPQPPRSLHRQADGQPDLMHMPQLSIRYTLQLGLLPLPKTENPEHMKSNARVDFDISDEDMETLKRMEPLDDYGEASAMPVFGGRPS